MKTETKTSLVELQRSLKSARSERAELIKSHEANLKSINAEIAEIIRLKQCAVSGLDLAIIALAESVVRVTGVFARNGTVSEQRAAAVNRAVNSIANGDIPMQKQYMGVKNYDHFGDQCCDCEYGMGPRHGNIVFRIESIERKRSWTDDERNAAIYYLSNIAVISKAKEAA